jgi:hypothetical protein
MSRRLTQALLLIFAVALVLATLLNLGIAFDIFVKPPDLADTLDLPTRLIASQPYREAIWPYDAATNLLYVVAFGALALVAGTLGLLAAGHASAALLRASALTSGLLGVAGSLLYVGATQITITQQYCDCGFKNEEAISQFWAINIVQGGTTWLGYGTIVFGAIALVASADALRAIDPPRALGYAAWIGAALLAVGLVLDIIGQGDAGDLVLAVATGILLPVWAVLIARSIARSAATPASEPAPSTATG